MVNAVVLFRVLLWRDSSDYCISEVCQNNRSLSLNILILMTAGLLLTLCQTKVIHVQLNQLVSMTSLCFLLVSTALSSRPSSVTSSSCSQTVRLAPSVSGRY